MDGARGGGGVRRGRKMSRATHRRLLANHKGTIKLPQCIAPQVCKSAASFAAAAAAISAAPSHSHTPLEQQEAEPNDFLSGSSICTLDEVECRRGNNAEWRERSTTSSPAQSNFLSTLNQLQNHHWTSQLGLTGFNQMLSGGSSVNSTDAQLSLSLSLIAI